MSEMTETRPKSGDGEKLKKAGWNKWLVAGLVSIPIWLFLAGFLLVDSYRRDGNTNAAGALLTLVAIVGLPAAAMSALALLLMLLKDTVERYRAARPAPPRALTPEEISWIEEVAAALRVEDLCDRRTAAAYHARLGPPGGGEAPFEAKYRGVLEKLLAGRPERNGRQWEEANAAIRRIVLFAGEASARDAAFKAGGLAAKYPGFSAEFYDWTLACARRFR